MTADLALGTHRCRTVAAAALRAAATGPAPWVDTAPNYGDGSHHRALAPALAAHLRMGVSTKVGFISRAVRPAALAAGVLTEEEAAYGHALAPDYVRWQVDRSWRELGRPCLDVVFVHNPERAGDRAAVHDGLRRAFAVLEEQAHAGRLSAYGVATWTGFTDGLFTVGELERLAREAAGSDGHHLRAGQLPVSLVEADALALAMEGRGPVVDAAVRGWEVFAHGPVPPSNLRKTLDVLAT